MLLEDKTAVIYGAGGSIGGAVARAFAREGARVFLAGRTRAKLDAVADEIRSAGGTADTAEVDALDPAAVDAHADAVASEGGSLDISFNLITHPAVHGTPLHEMELDDFMGSIVTAVSSSFLTSRAAARHMVRQRSGVILTFGGSGDPMRDYYIGGTQIAFEALEVLRRQLGTELARHGVRTVTLRTSGVPETLPEFEGREAIIELIEKENLLPYSATLEDVGNVAAFVASDRARTMTVATANVSCGALVD
jgi:NAD(P)-dependent dehydrogenase (short-subunit alcohol dehydrogenase family)